MSAPAIERHAAGSTGDAQRAIAVARRAVRWRALQAGVVLALVVTAIFVVSMTTGPLGVPAGDVVRTIVGEADPQVEIIVQDVRLPRALTGLLVGIGFGMAGAIFQSLLRNPLASPDVLGITSGASLAAVLVITGSARQPTGALEVAGTGLAWLPVGALLGAVATAVLMYMLAYRNGVSPYRLILIGIGIGATAQAAIDFMLTRALEEGAGRAFVWLTGTLNTRTWENVMVAAVGTALLVPIALMLGSRLRILQLGDDAAAGLGVRVQRARLAQIAVGVGLVGISVAAAGPIAFVALLAPPIARRIARSPGPSLVLSALTGAALVSVSDLAAQNVLPTGQIPVGIVTGAIGAPYMLWLLARANRIGRGG